MLYAECRSKGWYIPALGMISARFGVYLNTWGMAGRSSMDESAFYLFSQYFSPKQNPSTAIKPPVLSGSSFRHMRRIEKLAPLYPLSAAIIII